MSPLHDVLNTYILSCIDGHQITKLFQQALGSIAKYPFVVNMKAS
jgi:hypothetical protein